MRLNRYTARVRSRPSPARLLRRLRAAVSACLGLSLFVACEPTLHVGDLELECSTAEGGASSSTTTSDPVPAPWETGFEDGFCSYKEGAGFCYNDPSSVYELVKTPVHSGMFAAGFELRTNGASGIRQTRCVRSGVLPEEAFYEAWYYVPSGISAVRQFNLFHFRGGPPGAMFQGLWDVSVDGPNGEELTPYVLDIVRTRRYDPEASQPIPLDRWFKLTFYLKRAADTTGEVALFLDGTELVRVPNVITDDTPSQQWYVGSYSNNVAPSSTVTVFVDDVSIRLP